jgi:hypothetical protein
MDFIMSRLDYAVDMKRRWWHQQQLQVAAVVAVATVKDAEESQRVTGDRDDEVTGGRNGKEWWKYKGGRM